MGVTRKLMVFAVVALAVTPSRVRAQSEMERAAVEALRTELAGITDSVQLLERERVGIERARANRDDPMRHLELGFIGFRLGEVTASNQHYDDAAGEFEWAAELAPDWPYAWYGLGLAELALGEHDVMAVENIRQVLGIDYLSKAASAFARAAAADPGFVQGVVDLAQTAMTQRINARLEVARQALRTAATTSAAGSPAVQLARGRVERLSGEGDSALAAFEAYVTTGGDSALGLLEQARTLFFLRRADEAGDRYYRATSLLRRAEARALLRADLSWIATDEELTDLDGLPDHAVGDWVQRFWADRSARSARPPGERLPEHYRRYFYALRHYRLVSRHRRYDPVDAYRSTQQQLDDRGVIYVRHGEPDRRAQFPSLALDANESWLYRRPDGDLVFHFVARGDVQDYKLVESLLDVFGLDAAIRMQATGELLPEVGDLFSSRAAFGPVYGRIGAGARSTLSSALATERQGGRVAVRVGTSTDSHPLRFARSLDPSVQLYALGGADDAGARLLVVFAVPGRTLEGRELGQGVAYPLTVRVVSPAGEDGRGAFLDTTRVFVTEQALGGEQHLSGFVEVPVGAGRRDVRVVLAEPAGGAGTVVDVDSVVVPQFGTGEFALSDLVLGEVGSSLGWQVGRDTIPLSPLAEYPRGAEMDLYYEVHGLEAGAAYRARVEVLGKRSNSIFARIGRLFGGGGPPVSFEFEGSATGTVTRARQIVDLDPLKDGEYQVVLTVEDPARDIRHTRQAPFRVRSR